MTMIIVLLGLDALAKKNYIASWAASKQLEVIRVAGEEPLPDLRSLSAPALFGPKAGYVFDQRWKDLDPESLLEQAGDKTLELIIVEDTIDQRKTVNKTFLKDKRVEVKEFSLPDQAASERWLTEQAKELNIAIEPQAISELVNLLLPNDDAKLDVVQAKNELLKLKSYANGEKVTTEMVNEIVVGNAGVDIFALLNAIGTRNKPLSVSLMENFFEHSSGDEKAKSIQFSALMADQLRSILMVLDATQRNIPDNVVLEETGWKSGRLYNLKRISKNFTIDQVKQALSKLHSLDAELKTSSMPSHVVLDMIITQV